MTRATQVDHCVPIAKNGTDDLLNLQSLCDRHHVLKTAKDLGRRIRPRIGLDGYPIPE